MTMSFSHLSKNICPKELDLKVKRQGKYASFLDLDIKIEDFVRYPEKHLGNLRGNKGESLGNHRGIIWDIGETLPT